MGRLRWTIGEREARGERKPTGRAAARHEDGPGGGVRSVSAPDSADRQRQRDERRVRLEHERRDRRDRDRQLRAVRRAVRFEHACADRALIERSFALAEDLERRSGAPVGAAKDRDGGFLSDRQRAGVHAHRGMAAAHERSHWTARRAFVLQQRPGTCPDAAQVDPQPGRETHNHPAQGRRHAFFADREPERERERCARAEPVGEQRGTHARAGCRLCRLSHPRGQGAQPARRQHP